MKQRIITLATLFALVLLPALAYAAAAPEAAGAISEGAGYFPLAMGLTMGLAVFGGALGQGKAASAALEGIARNPNASGKIMTPMLLGLAFVESLVIFALLVAFLINGHIG